MSNRRSGPCDTDPVVAEMVISAHRLMSASEKMQRVEACNAASEAMARAGLRARHPGLTERELRLHLAALRLGRSTMIEVFGWDPESAENGQ